MFIYYVFSTIPTVFLTLSCILSQGLKGTVEKHSQVLGRNATYERTSTIIRLPAYVILQFVRFFHGRAGQSDELVSKKILKVN